MKSKISCFNKTIFKKNFTLYWPLWVGYLILMLAMVPVNLFQYMHQTLVEPQVKQYSALRNIFSLAASPSVLFVFCVAAVMCVFSYLYNTKNTNGMHGLPVTRLELFVTNTVSAFSFLAAADVISFIAAVFVGIGSGVTRIDVLLYMLLFQLGITFFGVAFATAVAMLTGNMIAMPVYCYIANYLYVIIREVLEEVIISITYGLYDLWGTDISYILSPLYYLEQKVGATTGYDEVLKQINKIQINGGAAVAAYAGAGVLLYLFAYRLYRRRQLETAGDVIAVNFMKPVFRFGLGICGGTALGYAISEMFYFDAVRYSDARFMILLCFTIICVFVGFFMAEMLMQKSFRIFKKKIIIEAVASAGIVVILLAALKGDVFGLESYMPKQEEIAEAWIARDYPVKYEGSETAELLDMHSQILVDKEQNLLARAEGNRSYSVTIKYVLTDGSFLVRQYLLPIDGENPLNPDTVTGQILAKEMEPERLKQYLLGMDYEGNRYLTGSMDLYDTYQNYMTYSLTEEENLVILEAFMKDLKEGNWQPYYIRDLQTEETTDEFMNDINIRFYNETGIEKISEEYYDIPMYYEDAGSNGYFIGGTEAVTEADTAIAFAGKADSSTFYMSFGKKCVNLVNALEELGIVNDTWHLYTHEEYEALE